MAKSNELRVHQLSGGGTTIIVDNQKTMSQLEKTGFHETIAPPERLLRCFRFDTEERIGKEK